MSFAHSLASTTCVSGNTRRSPVDVAVAVAVACLEQLSHAFLVADGARLAFGIRGLRHLLSLRGQLPLGHPATYRYPSRPRSSSSSASSPFNPRHICERSDRQFPASPIPRVPREGCAHDPSSSLGSLLLLSRDVRQSHVPRARAGCGRHRVRCRRDERGTSRA